MPSTCAVLDVLGLLTVRGPTRRVGTWSPMPGAERVTGREAGHCGGKLQQLPSEMLPSRSCVPYCPQASRSLGPETALFSLSSTSGIIAESCCPKQVFLCWTDLVTPHRITRASKSLRLSEAVRCAAQCTCQGTKGSRRGLMLTSASLRVRQCRAPGGQCRHSGSPLLVLGSTSVCL